VNPLTSRASGGTSERTKPRAPLSSSTRLASTCYIRAASHSLVHSFILPPPSESLRPPVVCGSSAHSRSARTSERASKPCRDSSRLESLARQAGCLCDGIHRKRAAMINKTATAAATATTTTTATSSASGHGATVRASSREKSEEEGTE